MTLQVQLLGDAQASLAASKVDFLPTMSYQALAYLAYQGDWVSRDELAFLFWADQESAKARHNVRQLLKRLKKLTWLSDLEVEPHRLRWQVETDVVQFRHAFDEQCWSKATSLYRGLLLKGLDKNLSADYEAWLELERSKLQEQWRDALLRHSHDLEQLGRLDQAAEPLATLLNHDILDEEGVRHYLQLALQTGQRERGLKAYQVFTKQLQDELGLTPTTLTQQLAESLRAAVHQAPSEPRTKTVAKLASTSSQLPSAATSFIGRDLELSEIAHLLSNPECRLVTLLGLGGIGKSRTALQAAVELAPRYPHGVTVVALETLTTPADIPAHLAGSLGLALQGKDPPLVQVKRALADKSTLLVLDNVEHLMDGVTLLSDLLEACPKLDMLATAQERLRLEQEWLLPLTGLSFPGKAVGLTDALHFDAVKLFVERAKRVRPDFALREHDVPAVLTICQLVEGSPLGLELAAVWVRAMTVQEIAREIESNLDFLASSSRNISSRQQSLRATFEHAWRLLTPKEQEVLKKLSVFRGGFKRDVAAFVAGASVAVLAAHVDKSLIRLSPQGRYERHPLIYRFTQEKLDEDAQEAETRAKHAQYFHAFLKEAESRLETSQIKTTLAEIDEELENLKVAWQWLLDKRDALKLRESAEAVRLYFDIRALYHEGVAWFELVVSALDEATPQHLAALGYAKQSQALYLYRQGRFEAAFKTANEALSLLKTTEDPKGLILAYLALGYASRYVLGQAAELGAYEKALLLARTLDDKPLLIRVLNGLGNASGTEAVKLDDLDISAAYYQEALSLCHESDDLSQTMVILANLGAVYHYRGGDKVKEGKRCLEASLKLARDLGAKMLIVENLIDLTYVHLELGDLAQAHACCQEAQTLIHQYEAKDQRSNVHMVTGEVALLQDDLPRARVEMAEAMALAREIGNIPILLETVRLCAQIDLAEGQTRVGLRRFAFVMGNLHRQIFYIAIRRDRHWWEGYKAHYAAEAIRDAEAWAQGTELEAVVKEVLEQDFGYL